MSRGGPRTRPVSLGEARLVLGKAEEFLATAAEARTEERNSAATGNSVHAEINAANARLGALSGLRGAGQDHNQVVELIKALPPIGSAAANQLRRLVPLKTKAEYDPAPISAIQAAAAVRQAEELAATARQVIARRTLVIAGGRIE